MDIKELLLSGAGGGGGGSFKNRPDNLRSTDSFEALIGLASVPVTLPSGGLSNIFVNDVAVEDSAGVSMLEDFTVLLNEGDPTQLAPVKLLFGSSAGPTNINLSLSNPNSSGPGPWVNATVTNQNVDFIDLRFVVNQLYSQNKDGIHDATASIEINLRPSGSSTWVNPFAGTSGNYDSGGFTGPKAGVRLLVQRMKFNASGTNWADTNTSLRITGKTTSPYVKEIRFSVPNTGAYINRSWEIRCRLVERESYMGGTDNIDQEQRSIMFESVAGVVNGEIGGGEGWRGLSYIHVFGKASDQLNGIPEIQGIYKLGQYLVPPTTVFNPETRIYTGTAWDGVTTQLAWTQCPAWQLKWLIEDDLSGVSALAPGSTMNKWDVLEASKWFSEPVPDGRGGTHPRYSANWVISEPMKVNDLVQYLAGAVGSFAWDEGDGRWRMKVEKPEVPQMIFTNENIVGEFAYSHTDIDSRFNDITGVYRDKDNRYIENRVRVFDQTAIDAGGRKHTTLALVGCDNRQEALRRTNLRLISSLKETRLVSFKTNRLGQLLEPLSVIAVADGDLNASETVRSTGRVTYMSGDRRHIKVRDALRLEPGVSYQVQVTVPNPNYSPDTTTQPVSAEWRKPTITITRNVTNTAAQRGDIYDIYLSVALPADTPEFAAIALSAVGLPALPKQYRVLGVSPDDDGETYSISASEIYTAKWLESDNIDESDILAQISGKDIPPPLAPAEGMFTLRSYNSEFADQRALFVNWRRPSLAMLDAYSIQMRHNDGPWQDLGRTKSTFYELVNPQHGTYGFRITVFDRRGRESAPLTGLYSVTELPSATTTPVAEVSSSTFAIPTDSAGLNGDYSLATGSFALRNGMGVVDTSEISFSVLGSPSWLTINASGEFTISETGADNAVAVIQASWNGSVFNKAINVVKVRAGEDAVSDVVAPPLVSGLVLGSTVQAPVGGTPWIKLEASWNLSMDPDVTGYVISLREGTGPWTEFQAGPLINSFYWNAQPSTAYTVRIRAFNGLGLSSAFTSNVTHTTGADATPPGTPTSITVAAAFQSVFVRWANPLDADLDYVEIWEGTAATEASSTVVARVKATKGGVTSYGRTGLGAGQTRHYRLYAVDTTGNRSAPSAWFSVTTSTIQGVDIGPNQITAPLIAANAVTSDKINVASLSAITANIGSLVSYATGGGRVERDGNGTRIFDAANIERVKAGF